MIYGPLTLFDALASTDVGSRFGRFDFEDLDLLLRYHHICRALASSTFFSNPVRLSVKVAPDERYRRLDHAGRDPLRSMAMDFRQHWMKKEPARFHAILLILRRGIAPGPHALQTRAILDHLGRRHRDKMKATLMRHVWADDPMGPSVREFTAEQVIDDWLYGGAFHFDADAARRVESWPSTHYEWSLINPITAIAGVCWELDLLAGAIVACQRPSALTA
jgi:hypothetical protein